MTFFFCLSDKDECLATCQDRQETFRWTHTRQERPNQINQTEVSFKYSIWFLIQKFIKS